MEDRASPRKGRTSELPAKEDGRGSLPPVGKEPLKPTVWDKDLEHPAAKG